MTGFIYDDIFLKHTPPEWHPERPERLKAILNAIEKRGLKERLVWLKPEKASIEDLKEVHTEEHIKRILQNNETYIDPDTYISKNSPETALYAGGAVIKGIDEIISGKLKYIFACVRPPGHHATRNRAMGFCLFNNIAAGARYALKKGIRKILIVDFDVHHGNGTQDIFYEDPQVFYFSTHEYPHYPGTGSTEETGSGKGKGFTRNIPMRSGAGDREYIDVYNSILPEIVDNFRPEIILVSAGYDIHMDDPLSSINVTDEGIRAIVKSILRNGIPAIFALEGGYDLDALGRGVAITLEEMLNAMG